MNSVEIKSYRYRDKLYNEICATIENNISRYMVYNSYSIIYIKKISYNIYGIYNWGDTHLGKINMVDNHIKSITMYGRYSDIGDKLIKYEGCSIIDNDNTFIPYSIINTKGNRLLFTNPITKIIEDWLTKKFIFIETIHCKITVMKSRPSIVNIYKGRTILGYININENGLIIGICMKHHKDIINIDELNNIFKNSLLLVPLK